MVKRKKPNKHLSRSPSGAPNTPAFRQQSEQAAKLLGKGSLSKAAPLCEALFRQKPDDPMVLKMLGYLRYMQKRLPMAISLLERAYAACPMDAQIRRSLIASYKEASQFEKALAMAQEFLDHPLNKEESILAFQTLCSACDWSSTEALRDKAVRQLIASKGSIPLNGDLLLALHGMDDVSPKDMFTLHQLAAAHEPVSLPDEFTPDQINPRGRLKIAYLSPDFLSHPVAYFVYPVIAAHNRQQVEVWCYAHLNKQDGITDKIRAATDHFIDITEMTNHDVAQRIRADGIHVLVDLTGHTAHSRLQVLSWRPAPVQISWLGYPNTSGMPEVDFHITDHDAECENGTRYTETLLYMPDSFLCFGMRPNSPRRETAPAEMNGYITFGSFNHIRKMNPRVIDTWCRILNRVPGSRMALKARWESDIVRNHVLAEFARHGIDEERIILLPVTKTYDEHVAQYNMIDLALDTFPYTGTTTTCEALWMGVPVVTLVGKTHANRVSYSILKSVGFTETIAHSTDEYVDKATHLAMNPGGLSMLRNTLPSLFEYSVVGRPEKFVPQLEALYMDACRQSGMDISGMTAPDTAAISAPQGVTDAGQEASQQMQPSPNPFDGLPGQKTSRGLMVVKQLTDATRNMIDSYFASPAAAEWLIVVIPYGSEQESTATHLDYISVAVAHPFSLIKLKDGPLDRDMLHSLVSVCGQYHSLEGELEPCEKLAHDAALEHGLPVIEYKTTCEKKDIPLNPPADTASPNKSHKNKPTEKSNVRKLHIGGKEKHPEWEILDAIPSELTDHVGNANDLSIFEDNTFDAVYSSHVLEHFSYQGELLQVLSEWHRVMKPGGALYASVPNLDALCELFLNKNELSPQDRLMVMRMMFGGQVDPYDFHKVGYNPEILISYIAQAGFNSIRVVEEFNLFSDTSNMEFFGKRISLNIIAKKPPEPLPAKALATDNLVWLCSYPKSGNTMVRIAVENYFNLPTLSVYRHVTKGDNSPLFGDDYSNAIGIKCHKVSEVPKQSAMVYIYRDPRDVLISYFKWNTGQMPNENEAQFNAYIQTNLLEWKSEIEQAIQFPGKKLLIRYEDIIQNPFDTYAQIFSFIGNDKAIDHNQLEKTIRNTTKEKASEWFEKLGAENQVMPVESKTTRWRELMNPEQINQVTQILGKEFLTQLGYASEQLDTAAAPQQTVAADSRVNRATWVLQTSGIKDLVIVDVGARIIDESSEKPPEHFYNLQHATVIAFEADTEACEKINTLTTHLAANISAYPYALGQKKGRQTLYVTQAGMCSSLYKSNEALKRRFEDMEASYLKEEVPIDIVSLDDFIQTEKVTNIDFIKIDVQGAELDVFKGGEHALQNIIGICTEVEWAELYENQPMFADVDHYLRMHGFQLHHLLSIGSRPMKGGKLPGSQQFLWSDAVYFPTFERIETLPADKLTKLAAMAILYDAHDLALHVLKRYDEISGAKLATTFYNSFHIEQVDG